ncbi:MAG: hypothetical protein LW724_09375 [Planctomycetaceae bacterium]|nr:hypothetical protein [Planctomycetaceae bacterium]
MKIDATKRDDARVANNLRIASCMHGMFGNTSRQSHAYRFGFVEDVHRVRRRSDPRIKTIPGQNPFGTIASAPSKYASAATKGSPSTNSICMSLDHGKRIVKDITGEGAWSAERRNRQSYGQQTSQITPRTQMTPFVGMMIIFDEHPFGSSGFRKTAQAALCA